MDKKQPARPTHTGSARQEALRQAKSKGQKRPTHTITARAAELGLMLLSCGVYYNTIRVLVPITVSDAVFDEGLDLLARAIRDTAA